MHQLQENLNFCRTSAAPQSPRNKALVRIVQSLSLWLFILQYGQLQNMFHPEKPTAHCFVLPQQPNNSQPPHFPSNVSLALKSGGLALGRGTGRVRAMAFRSPVAPGRLGI